MGSQGNIQSGRAPGRHGHNHIVYRAIGADGVSRLGYALSDDGIHFDDRSPYPIFSMAMPLRQKQSPTVKEFSPVMYPSGGSWGGSEDPRLVKIDGRVTSLLALSTAGISSG